MKVANTPAYYDMAIINAVKSLNENPLSVVMMNVVMPSVVAPLKNVTQTGFKDF